MPGNDYDICGIVSTHRTIGVFSYSLPAVSGKSLFELQSTNRARKFSRRNVRTQSLER